MWYIQKNSTQDLIFTCTELSSLSNPYFLCIIKNRETKNEINFVITNQSTAVTRYDKLVLIESGITSQNLTATTPCVNLSPGGFWDYRIYEQSSATNLALSGVTGGVLEYGIALVSGYTQTSNYFFSAGSINNHIFLKT